MAPIQLFGTWQEGYALDVYMESSEYIGEDVFGHCKDQEMTGERESYSGREHT